MPYPIKYIENNLVWNIEGECFAYYELIPFNYSFLSLEQKDAVHDAFRQLIAQNRDGKIHALQISTESSIRAAQERSKKSVTGRLKEIACAEIDEQTENLMEIAMMLEQLKGESEYLFEVLTDIDSITWKQKFVDWANEFTETYEPNKDVWPGNYLEVIEGFAREKILEFAGVEEKE